MTHRQTLLLSFIQRAHGEQKRKYTSEPYWTHPLAVAEIILTYAPDTPFGVEIALLHDVMEDTAYNKRELIIPEIEKCAYSFAEAVTISYGVLRLTDQFTKENYPDINRKERKRMEASRLSKIGQHCQTIKCADIIHNLESISLHDKSFAKILVSEITQADLSRADERIYKMYLKSINAIAT